MATQQRKIPAPPINPETKPFWDGGGRGQVPAAPLHRVRQGALVSARHLPVLLQRQDRMGRSAPGKGKIYTFSVMRRARRCPTRSPM